ncbi:MAG: two-component regulator propeller domain-containing protein [Bacteroidota bacterium]
MNKIAGYITTLIFICNFLLQGQNAVINHFSVNQGLPSSECYWVMQDSKGYIWIATDAGVVKYDGYNFITYNSSKGLPDNTVFKIHEDNHGKVWFATYSGKFAFYSHSSDSIIEIAANKRLDKLTDHYPVDFAFDNHDTLYISISRRGYVKVFPPNYSVVKHYTYDRNCYFIRRVNEKNVIYGTTIYTEDFHKGNVPLIYDNGYSSKTDTSFKVKSSIAHLSAINSGDTAVLFSNSSSIFFVSNKGKQVVHDYKENIYKTVSLYKDKDQRLWINGLNNGTRVIENLNFDKPSFQFLEKFSVSSVCQDSDNGYWITTLEDGVYYIPSLNFSFIGQAGGLTANKVLSISLLKNKLSCLTSDFSMSEIDLDSHKMELKEKFGFAAWNISQSDSCMLVCCNFPYIIRAGQSVKIPLWVNEKNNEKTFIKVRKAIDYNQDYFMGFDQGHLIIINKKTGECKIKKLDLPNIFSVNACKEKVWIGTKSGLYMHDGKKVIFLGEKNPILRIRVEDMICTGDTLWLATRGSGVLCLFQNRIIKQYIEANGLASNMTKCIIKDELDNIWIGTNRGISRLKKNTDGVYMVSTLNMYNGLISNEVNKIVEYNSKLYFATNKGLGILNVKDFYNPTVSIPVYIEEFQVDNKKLSDSQYHSLSHTQNFISVVYKGVSVKSNGDITYKYKLDGLDTNWTYTRNTYVQFTTLPSGKYNFIVYALNQDGNPSNAPASVSFEILKPFWMTWWFWLFILSLFLAVVYFIYRNRVNRIKRVEEEKTALSKKIAESELKALRAQMNPHFIFNAINSIQNFVLKNNTEYASRYLAKFARLIRFVLENSKHQLILFSKELAALELYIELEQMRASFSFDYEIIIDDRLNAKEFFIPPLLIQPFIENAIIHGIMPLTDRKGKMSIRFSGNESTLLCEVEDNGIGRAKAMEIKHKKQMTHKSMGMEVTTERISLLNQQNDSLAKVKVHDKIVNGIAAGTIVEISIKLKNSHYD